MPGCQVFLHFEDLLRDDDRADRVFLAVDDALLKRRHRLAPLHLLGIGTESVHHVDIHRTRDAHVQALHVVGGCDRADVIGDFAKAVLAPSQNFNALVTQDALQQFGGGSLCGRIDLCVVGIEVGQREDRHFGDQGRHVDRGRDDDVERTAAHHLCLLHLVTARELGVRKDADVVGTVGFLGQKFAEFLGTLVPSRGVAGIVR